MPEVPLLVVHDLRREFVARSRSRGLQRAIVRAVDGVSFELAAGEALAIVGESGSGKTTLARAVVGLTKPTSGRMEFDGLPLDWSRRDARALRSQVQMIFQDPLGSLDPRWRVHDLVREPLDNFSDSTREQRDAAVEEVLAHVGLDATQASKRPAELSGGQRQRVGIARAIALRPRLVVCDEPVSALDVSIRGQILDLLARLRHEFQLTYVFISHDLSSVQKLCDRVLTMYLGQVVELSPVSEFFQRPHHPYAQALISAVPIADPAVEARRERIVLRGEVADATSLPTGCRFHPRCPLAQGVCVAEEPELREVEPGRWARCHFAPNAQIASATKELAEAAR